METDATQEQQSQATHSKQHKYTTAHLTTSLLPQCLTATLGSQKPQFSGTDDSSAYKLTGVSDIKKALISLKHMAINGSYICGNSLQKWRRTK